MRAFLAARAFRLGFSRGPLVVIMVFLVATRFAELPEQIALPAIAGSPVILAAPFLLWPARRGDAARFMVGSALGVLLILGPIVGAFLFFVNALSDPAGVPQ